MAHDVTFDMIAIATHAVFYENGEIHGPADAVSRYLQGKRIPHALLKHPLWGKYQSVVLQVTGKKEKRVPLGVFIGGIIRYPYDIFLNGKYLLADPRITIFIGVDPLNCIAAILFKVVRRNLQVVYFTVDFASKRFDNPILNFSYHFLDRICAKNANYCWSVSSRIVDYRTKQGVAPERNLHIPNSPPFAGVKRKRFADIAMHDLVLVSNLNAGIPFDALFASLRELRKQFPDIRLKIIGGGEGENKVRSKITKYGLDTVVDLLGQQPHAKVHEILASCSIGIALYTDTAPWRYYSDSMKARDYMACGLPVIISGDLATVDDIISAEAGLAIEPSTKNIVNAVKRLLANTDTYIVYRSHAIANAKVHDIDGILEQAFAKLLATHPG